MKKGALFVGYARVSKADDQHTVAQVKTLRHVGCKRIFEEKASGCLRWAMGSAATSQGLGTAP